MAIKHRLGKLPVDPACFAEDSVYDRLLIAQARLEGLMAVSSDATWPGYSLALHRA